MKVFIDSNLWLYLLLDGQDEGKARKVLNSLNTLQGAPVISAQVLNECVATLIRKQLAPPGFLKECTERFRAECQIHPLNANVTMKAIELHEQSSLSWWDSLIIAAALESGCGQLWSEDLQHGRVFDDRLRIVNPLLAEDEK